LSIFRRSPRKARKAKEESDPDPNAVPKKRGRPKKKVFEAVPAVPEQQGNPKEYHV